MAKDVIIALDFNNRDEVFQFLQKFKNEKPFIKIGMELYLSEGKEIVQELKEQGYQIFLDLKLHDIPVTVNKTLSFLKTLEIDILNVHALGGKEMLMQAHEALANSKTKLIAVTHLTSLAEEEVNQELGIVGAINDSIINLARLAFEAGLEGVVCSGYEARIIKENTSTDFLTICPGIRLNKENKNDQKRIMTPLEARENNVDYIVVGRDITQSKDPEATYLQIKKIFKGE